MWQEYVITAITLALTASLLPTLRDPDARIPIGTSALTATGLFIKTLMFASLGMVSITVGTSIGCILWTLILYTKSGIRERIAERRAPSNQTTGRTTRVPADD